MHGLLQEMSRAWRSLLSLEDCGDCQEPNLSNPENLIAMPETRLHHRACNLCEAMCGIVIELEGDEIRSIRGDKNDPFSKGHVCPKAVALKDVYEDPDRLRQPIRKKADGSWEEIGWEEAFDYAAERIKAVQTEYGNNAVATYHGNPNIHNLGHMIAGKAFTKALRTRTRFSATSVDQLPHHTAGRAMFGHMMLLPIPDVDRTDYFLMLGANPLASNGSLMTAGGIEPRLKAMKARGGKLIVVDPRRTETAKLADKHLFIRPGSDAVLLMGLLHVVMTADGFHWPDVAFPMSGREEIESMVADWNPEMVSKLTGIPAETVVWLGQDFAAAKSAVAYGRMGLSVQKFGGLCQWMLNLLNIVTGNLDSEGGSMFTTPAVDITQSTSAGNSNRWTSRVRKLPESFGELPVSAMTEDMDTPGEGQIKALVTVAGNPVLSTPAGHRLEKAMQGLDFMMSIDIYLNETTAQADLILPPATGLEVDHYDLTFHALAVRNTAKYSSALFEPGENTRYDYQIFRELGKRLATEERPWNPMDPSNIATPAQILDYLLNAGPHDVNLAKLVENPSGIDLGALEPVLPGRLHTESGAVELAPKAFLADLERLRRDSKEVTEGLILIGRRDLRTNNSWMHNSQRLVKGPKRCTLYMNPADARERGLKDGEEVQVRSAVGSVEIPLVLTEDIMPGVVCMPHGWGHNRKGIRMKVAQEYAGVSINDLTDPSQLDELTGNAALNSLQVEVMASAPVCPPRRI